MPLVKPAELARMMNVKRQTVANWIKNGSIAIGEDGLIDSDQAIRMRAETESPLPHHQARKAQFDEAKATQGIAKSKTIAHSAQKQDSEKTKQTEESINVSIALKLETYKLQKSKAELAALEVDKAAGALVERSEVDFVLTEFGNTLRGLLEGLPDRLAGQLSAHRGDTLKIHKDLEDAAYDLLSEISQLMQRKIGGGHAA